MEKITLLGHVSQTGQYPMPVVAIGRLKGKFLAFRGKLVAAMRNRDMQWEYTELDEDYEYVKYNTATDSFDPEKWGLFAYTPEYVELFKNDEARDFFRRVLQHSLVKQASPFIRIGFVREAELWDEIPALLMEQLDVLKNEAAFLPTIRKQLAEAEQAAGHKLDSKALEERIAQIEREDTMQGSSVG